VTIGPDVVDHESDVQIVVVVVLILKTLDGTVLKEILPHGLR